MSIRKGEFANASLCGGQFYARMDLSTIPATALRPCRVNGCVYCEPALVKGDVLRATLSKSGVISMYGIRYEVCGAKHSPL